ncbi:MAG: hypothetical protein QXD46_03205 [Thermofilum sp.]
MSGGGLLIVEGLGLLGGRVAVYPEGRVLVISGDRAIAAETALPVRVERAFSVDCREVPEDVVAAEVRSEGLLLVVRTREGEVLALGGEGLEALKLPPAEKWCGFPCSVLEKAARAMEGEWGFAGFELEGDLLAVSFNGLRWRAVLGGCSCSFKAEVNVHTLKKIHEAFKAAGLKPVSVAFNVSGRVVLMRLRGGWLTVYTAFATG